MNALVVGASQGIGLGFVRSLLADSRAQRIFATDRQPSTAAGLFALQEQWPDRLSCLSLDVTDEAQIATALTEISEAVGNLHLVLYCVGVLHEGELSPEKSLRQVNAKNLMTSFEVNSIGAVLVAKHAATLFDRSTPGVFAAISAKVGSIGDNRLGGWYGYRASKAALNMFMRTAAIEYRHRCPRTIVVTLHPGTTDTRLSKPFQDNVPEEQLFSVEESVAKLTGVLANLEPGDSGKFFSWNGNPLPW